MTSQGPRTPDEFDAFERRLASRVTRHADHGVRPFDAGAIAHEAALAGGRPTGRLGAGATFLGRLGWLVAGAAIAAGAIGGAAWAGSHGFFGVATSSPQPSLVAIAPTAAPTVGPSLVTPTASATATPTTPPTAACRVADLAARVTAWNGAAGNRVATVVLTNNGSTSCKMQTLERPQLVDGNGTVLIDGAAPSHPGSITIAAGGSVSTMVDDANYCGPAPKAPVTVAFVFSGGQKLVASARSATDTFGAPDCMGSSVGGDITMHPWAH